MRTSRTFSAAILTVVLLAIVATNLRTRKILASKEQHVELLHATVWATSVSVWLCVWTSLVPFEIRERVPLAYAGLLWPILIFWVHLMGSSDCLQHLRSMPRTPLQWDSNAIIGFAFTTGALFQDPTVRRSSVMTRLLLAPVALCLCLVLCMPFYEDESTGGILTRLLQKWSLTAAVGFLVTLLAVRVSCCRDEDLQELLQQRM